MPESGEEEFQLVFPPLSDNATSFDFTEGEKVENGFSIWGIQLKSKKLPELALHQNAVVHKADPNAELPEPVIQYGKAMLKGKLLDSRPNMGMPISIAVWENIKGDITDIPLDIQPDGSFTKEVTLPGTTPCTIYLGREHMLQFFMGTIILFAIRHGPHQVAQKSTNNTFPLNLLMMVPMKEELKGKDIVYLYITGETSPLKTWENMIPDIHGEHFRLTDTQWKYLSDAFKIEGVPTYLVVDREGNTTFRQTGFPGVEKMKEELLKVTK